MPNTDVFAFKRSGLSDFVFSTVGDEQNGMALNLMSVFARADTDPWQEAKRLAMLPRAEAIESLARSIAEMPSSLLSLPAATAIAERLVVLLPEKPKDRGRAPVARTTRLNILVKTGLEAAIVAILIAQSCGLL
jgi:hypothetical protein